MGVECQSLLDRYETQVELAAKPVCERQLGPQVYACQCPRHPATQKGERWHLFSAHDDLFGCINVRNEERQRLVLNQLFHFFAASMNAQHAATRRDIFDDRLAAVPSCEQCVFKIPASGRQHGRKFTVAVSANQRRLVTALAQTLEHDPIGNQHCCLCVPNILTERFGRTPRQFIKGWMSVPTE